MALFGDELQDTGMCRSLVGQVDTGVLQFEEPRTLNLHLSCSAKVRSSPFNTLLG